MLRTRLCDLLDIDIPIVQAPIGSATTPALAAAVSEEGALGTLALTWTPRRSVADRVAETRALTDRPFAVNLVLAWPQHERMEACLEAGAPIVSTAWGDPAPYAAAIRSAGALHIHMVGSTDDAIVAVEAGVDVVVAQGWEAGGHVCGEIATTTLVPAVADAVDPSPVVAAGGVGEGRSLVAALALGAAGVWVGTRFLLAEEASVHDVYKQQLIRADEGDTTHSTVFNLGWDAPHRTLTNSTILEWDRAGRPKPGERPREGEVVASHGAEPLLRYSDALAVPGVSGDVEALPLYAGQSVRSAKRVMPAREIIREIVSEADHVLERLSLP
jgi:NAD(P)H-dependent flavin oxidoreductase YrpB (nitropropane dioxygenase family)